MAEKPDNRVLKMLREIRGILDENTRKLGEHDKRFDELNTKFDEWQETTATGMGFAVHANIRGQALENEVAELKRRIEKLETTH